MSPFKTIYLIIFIILFSNNLWGQCYGLPPTLMEIPTTKGYCEAENCLKARANRKFYIFPDKQSTLTDLQDSIEIKYDDKNRIIEYIDYFDEYDHPNQFKPNIRHLFQYEEGGTKIIRMEQRWRNENWVDTEQITFYIDENGAETRLIFALSSQQEEVVKTKQIHLTYTENHQIEYYLEEIITSEGWKPLLSYELNYDSRGNLIYQVIKERKSGTWELEIICEMYFEFDSLDNKTLEHKIEWMDGQIEWETKDSFKTETIVIDNQITINHFRIQADTLKLREKEQLIYNNSNQLEVHSYDYRSTNIEDYFYHRKKEFQYVENTNQLEREAFFYLSEGEWVLSSTKLYNYNENNQLSSVVGDLLYEGGWYDYPIENYTYDEAGQLLYKKEYQNNFIRESAVISREEVIFYYNDFNQLTNISPSSSLVDFSIYPNPVNHSFYIKIPPSFNEKIKLSLYNTTGILVKEISLTKKHQEIPTTDLTKGIYFAHIASSNGHTVRKIIIGN